MTPVILIPISWEAITIILLVLAAAGYEFVINLADIVLALAYLGFFVWLGAMFVWEMLYSFQEKKLIRFLYAIKYIAFGFAFLYFSRSASLIVTDYGEMANCVSIFISLIPLSILTIAEYCMLRKNSKFVAFLVSLALQILVLLVAQTCIYNIWKGEQPQRSGEEITSFVVNHDTFPQVSKTGTYKYKQDYTYTDFICVTKKFKKGEKVYTLNDRTNSMIIGMTKDWRLCYEDFYLVSNENGSVVGYVPKSRLEGCEDENAGKEIRFWFYF